MPDFLGERRRRNDDASGAKKKRPSLDDIKPPAPPKHQARRPEQREDSNLRRFSRDFKNGLTSLNAAIDKLSRTRETSKPVAQSVQRAGDRVDREVQRTERIVERVQQSKTPSRQQRAATPDTKRPTSTPQTQAVARPTSPTDKTSSLIKTAKAKEAGRLPFVNPETRKRAAEKIAEIKKKEGKSPTPVQREPRSRTVDRSSASIERREPPKSTAPQIPQNSTSRQSVPDFVAQKMRTPETKDAPKPTKRTLKEPEARKLSRAIPRFETQGAAPAGSPMIIEGDETKTNVTASDVSVVHRAGSKESSGSELPPNAGAVQRNAAAAELRRSTPASDNPAAAAAPTSAQRPAQMAAAATGGGGTAGGQGGGGNMTIEGTLRLEGMSQGGADNSEALAQLNARVVRIEGEMNG